MTTQLETPHPLHEVFDPENPDLSALSLCVDCAKHSILKRFVEKHSAVGPVCVVCQEVAFAYPACALDRVEELVNLIKGLIRFYYDEFEYNRHFGGDEIHDLMTSENPILEHSSSGSRVRSYDKSVDLLREFILSDPYPDPDKGVWVYAGFDEGIRHANHAIKDTHSPLLGKFQHRLSMENYFDVEPELISLIDRFSTRITKTITAGSRYYRARVGVEERYLDHGGPGLFPAVVFKPYSKKALGAPPPLLATAGRLNRTGVSFLYLASDTLTAAAEVRPHPGQMLSIGEFECLEDIKIASFEVDIDSFTISDHELDLFHFIYSTEKLMALPVIPSEAVRYSITQLLSNCLRQKDFDGLEYKSSVGAGTNICVFKPSSFKQVENSSTVKKVESLSYSLNDVDTILVPDADHTPLGKL